MIRKEKKTLSLLEKLLKKNTHLQQLLINSRR